MTLRKANSVVECQLQAGNIAGVDAIEGRIAGTGVAAPEHQSAKIPLEATQAGVGYGFSGGCRCLHPYRSPCGEHQKVQKGKLTVRMKRVEWQHAWSGPVSAGSSQDVGAGKAWQVGLRFPVSVVE